MDKKFACYCGLCCLHCSVKTKVEPAARVLRDEMKSAGFEDVIAFIPGGEGFWAFLKGMADEGVCVSCRDGSGNPGCEIRICAKTRGVEMCAFCGEYPCEKLAAFFKTSVGFPVLENDNALLRENGWDAWSKLQDERRKRGYSYSDGKEDA
ncbi:MAG: DUF3795 domain-containing protein [Defluviitaleaceae bacterium]|nr:DUF3795 domain-containing protein [Defluviitaleaceae bacterium]